MKNLSLLALVVLAGCPGTPGVDGGTGGTGGGGSTGGGTGGSTGGGTGGGVTGGGTGGSAGGVALTDFCAKQAEATCAFSVRCGAATPGVDCQKLAIPTRFSLISARQDCLASARDALAAGRTVYDGVQAQSCFEAAKNTAACNATLQFFDPACMGVFTGTATVGTACYATNDCAAGLYCDSTARVCPGTCRTRVPVGGTATGAASCAQGTFYAGQTDGGGSCYAPVAPGGDCAPPPGGLLSKICAGANGCQATDGGRTCVPFKSAGQPCSIFGFAECALDTECASGADGGPQCLALKKSGESCFTGGLGVPCQAGLSCLNNVCGPLVAAGGACFEDADCVAGHLCGTGQLCRPFAAIDAGCNTANFQGDCAVGSFCNTTSARCEPQRGLDATCTGSECSIERGLNCTNPGDGGVSRCRPAMCLAP